MVGSRKGPSKRGGLMAALALAVLPPALGGCDLSARAGPATPAPGPLRVGFYDAWDQSDLLALPRQLAGLDVFSPRWLTIRGARGVMHCGGLGWRTRRSGACRVGPPPRRRERPGPSLDPRRTPAIC